MENAVEALLKHMDKNGGPAYPCNMENLSFTGMTLRDWFAGQALIGIVMDGDSAAHNAKWAYEAADAMLKEREK